MLEIYATEMDFLEIVNEDDNEAMNLLSDASRNIDTLTFNRIKGMGGFNNLTPFQKDIVKTVTCKLASFEAKNAEVIQSVLSSYSINGVSMNFGQLGTGVTVTCGIVIPKDLYSMLLQTGLCFRVV